MKCGVASHRALMSPARIGGNRIESRQIEAARSARRRAGVQKRNGVRQSPAIIARAG